MTTPAERELRRDAIFLMAAERPFTRWSEISEKEREAYLKKARRLREHLKTYEPLTRPAI